MGSLARVRHNACPHTSKAEHADASSDRAEGSRGALLRDFIADDNFPCVGAKTAVSRQSLCILECGRLGDKGNDVRLLDSLSTFAQGLAHDAGDKYALHSFAVVFDGPSDTDERRFEALLWSQLQRLHDLDVRRGHAWASDVSTDPASPHFSLSLGGHPFFVIGLHPGASRHARRFGYPTLVFNSHRQFMRLRADGRYGKMQSAIRKRDIALQGSINPNLADFGEASEALQYTGRAVEPGWQCPLRVRKVQ